MTDFPESRQILRQQLMFADTGVGGKLDNVPKEIHPDTVRKIWAFGSGEKTEVKVQTNSLSIVSLNHKTYNNPGSEKKFRDVVSL
jgi:hypothetical protein